MFILIWTTKTRINKKFQLQYSMVSIVDGNTLMLP